MVTILAHRTPGCVIGRRTLQAAGQRTKNKCSRKSHPDHRQLPGLLLVITQDDPMPSALTRRSAVPKCSGSTRAKRCNKLVDEKTRVILANDLGLSSLL